MKPAPPLLKPCIFFCLGIVFAKFFPIPLLVFLIAAGASLFLKMTFKRPIFLLAVAFFFGGALLRNSQSLPSCHIERFTPYRGEHSYIEGIIESDPVYQTKNITFVLNAKNLKIGESSRSCPSQKVCGKVLVKVFDTNEKFSYGERLLLEGKLYKVFNLSISERLNYRDYLKYQGIYSIFSVKKGSQFERLANNRGSPIVAFAFNIRHRLKEIVENNLSPLSASILNAIILGERHRLPQDVKENLVNSGTVHIIAISGLHLGIVAFIILIFFKFIRMPKKWSYILTIPILIIYCLLTGSRTPVIRATIMALILLLGYILEREADIFNSLSLAAFIILAINPWQLFDVSFQLSFMSIVSIVWLSPKIKNQFGENLRKQKILNILITLFSISLAAWLGLLPLIAYYFKILSPITVLANMLIVPYMTPFVASGFLFILSGLISPVFAAIFSTINEALTIFLLKITSLLVHIPFAYFHIPSFPICIILIYYLILFIIFKV